MLFKGTWRAQASGRAQQRGKSQGREAGVARTSWGGRKGSQELAFPGTLGDHSFWAVSDESLGRLRISQCQLTWPLIVVQFGVCCFFDLIRARLPKSNKNCQGWQRTRTCIPLLTWLSNIAIRIKVKTATVSQNENQPSLPVIRKSERHTTFLSLVSAVRS